MTPRWLVREQLVHGRAERVNIRPVIDRDLPPLRLLRAHVGGRADEVAGEGEGFLSFEPCQSKVEDAQAALAVEDEVRGFDVAVDDAL